jgi:hypothetical protein
MKAYDSAFELLTSDSEQVAAYKKSSYLMDEITDFVTTYKCTEIEASKVFEVPLNLIKAAATGNFSKFLAAQQAE